MWRERAARSAADFASPPVFRCDRRVSGIELAQLVRDTFCLEHVARRRSKRFRTEEPPVPRRFVTVDGNEAAAYVAHQTNEVIAIYPITPATPMGELADAWSTAGQTNIFAVVPALTDMRRQAGAADAILC